MAETPEFQIETLVIAILQDSADLAGANIGHYDSTATPDAARIGVQVTPKTPMVFAYNSALAAPVWQGVINIYAQKPLSDTPASFDSWRNAIDVAMIPVPPSTYPAQVIVDATADFPNGLLIDIPSGGDTEQPGNDYRTLLRAFRVMWRES